MASGKENYGCHEGITSLEHLSKPDIKETLSKIDELINLLPGYAAELRDFRVWVKAGRPLPRKQIDSRIAKWLEDQLKM